LPGDHSGSWVCVQAPKLSRLVFWSSEINQVPLSRLAFQRNFGWGTVFFVPGPHVLAFPIKSKSTRHNDAAGVNPGGVDLRSKGNSAGGRSFLSPAHMCCIPHQVEVDSPDMSGSINLTEKCDSRTPLGYLLLFLLTAQTFMGRMSQIGTPKGTLRQPGADKPNNQSS
jgi:hypothetical protein